MADTNEELDIDQDSELEDSEQSKGCPTVGSLAETQKVLDSIPDDESGSWENSTQSTSAYKPAIHLMVPNQQSSEIDEILQMTEQIAKDEALAAQQAPNILRSSVDSKSISWQLSSDTSLTARGITPPNREWSPREKKQMRNKNILVRGKSTKHPSARVKSNKQISRNSVPISIRETGRSWKKKSFKEKLKAGEEKVDMDRWLNSSITSVNTTTSESSSWDCSDGTDSTTYFEDSLNLDFADVRHKERKVMRRRIRHKNYRWQRSQRRASDDLINALSNELLPLDDDADESNTDLVEDRSHGASSQNSNQSKTSK